MKSMEKMKCLSAIIPIINGIVILANGMPLFDSKP